MHRLAFLAILLTGCGGGTVDDTIKITAVTPDHASVSGGSHIVITGQGFLRDGAAPNRVIIGETAVLGAASDDATLELDAPPADAPGDVAITVFNRNGTATATGLLHYSTPPTITTVSPSAVIFDSTTTTVTLTGSGFADEDAGVNVVEVNGTPGVDVNVVSDTQLTFTPVRGIALVAADLQVTNARGTGVKAGGLVFRPFANPGLVVYAKDTSNFLNVYDPVADTAITIRRTDPTVFSRFHAFAYDANGVLWASGSNDFGSTHFLGQIDLTKQAPTRSIATQGIMSMARMGTTVYAIDKSDSFGTLDLTTGKLTKLASVGNYRPSGIASDGTNLYLLDNSGISTVDPTTGVRGTVVGLNPGQSVEEMRFLGGTLYATTAGSGNLISINPITGATVVVHTFPSVSSALEVFP